MFVRFSDLPQFPEEKRIPDSALLFISSTEYEPPTPPVEDDYWVDHEGNKIQNDTEQYMIFKTAAAPLKLFSNSEQIQNDEEMEYQSKSVSFHTLRNWFKYSI